MNENELDQWATLALHDAETAQLLAKENGYPEIIIYHMHQAIEKYLKALTVKAGHSVRRTHHIDVLLSELIRTYPSLEAIKEPVLFIHTYSPRLRYPTGDTLQQSDVDIITPKFEKILATISSLI
jgi:HEPN domain-containing protein